MAEINNAPQTEALAKVESSRQIIEMGPRGLALASLDDAWRFAQFVAKSGLAPKDFIGKPEAILIAIQMGAEVGLPPMASLQNIAVINGRPSIWGDAALALVQSHPQYEWHKEYFEGESDQRAAVFQIKRKGQDVHETRFSIADARRAGLLNKDTYKNYPDRMIQMRARGFGIRDKFADALRGMITSEEAGDYPGGPVLDANKLAAADAEKPLREEAERLMKEKGQNEAQREATLSKYEGRLPELLAKLKPTEMPTTQSTAGDSAGSEGPDRPAGSTPEGQGSVTPESSDSVQAGPEPRQSAAQPSGSEVPSKGPASAPPVQSKPAPVTQSKKQSGFRF